MGGWEALPVSDVDEAPTLSDADERLRAALKVCGMAALGLSIGCMFLVLSWALGLEA